MKGDRKTAQLQIRVSPAQKRAIQARARRAGMSMSDWVLTQLLPPAQETFQSLVEELARSDQPGYAFAELLEWLASLGGAELRSATAEPPRVALEPYWANYVAATLEHAAAQRATEPPAWVGEVEPLDEPVFGSSLESLRLHLLTHSPPPFARRNIFIDTGAGGRV